MTRRFWTTEERALLADLYPHMASQDVAALMGVTLSAVNNQAHLAKLKKSAEYLASDAACRVRRGHQSAPMIASRFKAGQPAWNNGVKGVTGTQEACRATQFKKGRPASEARNYVPIGSYRISKDGYLECKLSDDSNIAPARRWVAVHRTVWEAAIGPIPAGHIVRFRSGMKTTELAIITADRLECISRVENMQRNTYHRYPPEIAKTIQLRGALTRQINKHTQGETA